MARRSSIDVFDFDECWHFHCFQNDHEKDRCRFDEHGEHDECHTLNAAAVATNFNATADGRTEKANARPTGDGG